MSTGLPGNGCAIEGTSGVTAKVCVATVTTESYLPGTLVALGSFLKRHPNFDGDIVVIQDELPEASRQCLRALCGEVLFAPVGEELRERVARLGAELPRFGMGLSHFLAFEAFRLRGYRKVLFCDGDLLFLQPVDELFARSEALLCCGDWAHLTGRCRDAASFAPLDDPAQAGPAGALRQTFNDGFLLIDAELLQDRVYDGLLALLTPETWRGTNTPHTKQFLQNRYFAGRQTLISSKYNYLLSLRHSYLLGISGKASPRGLENLSIDDAKCLHFNVPEKPWMPIKMLNWTRGGILSPAFKLWYDAWVDLLALGHVRSIDWTGPVTATLP